jgi:hypothetical protein
MENLSESEAESLRHWANFGQSGNGSKERVLESACRHSAFRQPVRTAWVVPVAWTLVPKLLNGFNPVNMEDKWFVYADGPDVNGKVVVHFVRSWTGVLIAQVEMQLEKSTGGKGNKASFEFLVWESSNEDIRDPSEHFAKEMVQGVCSWVLGADLWP